MVDTSVVCLTKLGLLMEGNKAISYTKHLLDVE